VTGTDALITAAMFIGMFGLAGVLCWVIEVWARRRQADWTGESGMRGLH